MADTTNHVLLDVRDLRVHFHVPPNFITREKGGKVQAVDGVTLTVERGETLGLVGESGSGKSTLSLAILQLIRCTSGSVRLNGQELTTLNNLQLRSVRKRMQMVFQNPIASLDPRMTVREIVEEPMQILGIGSSKEWESRVNEVLGLVGLDSYQARRYPHEFSGGQCQRIGIARALAVQPDFLVLDEPVSALDVSIQAQIINLLQDLRRRFGLTYLFIAHNLAVVRHVSSRVAVMYCGKIVEMASREELYNNPLHPYTQALLLSAPVPDPFVEERRESATLRGEVPSPLNPPTGCRFHPRCPVALSQCALAEPALEHIISDHAVACIRVREEQATGSP
jgi:oligopeptide transport system ATP-binding protein